MNKWVATAHDLFGTEVNRGHAFAGSALLIRGFRELRRAGRGQREGR